MPHLPRFVALPLAALMLFFATPAAAQPAPAADLVVVLQGGASYRGALVENVPGDHITIRQATGEIRRFGYGEVASVSPVASGQVVAVPDPGELRVVVRSAGKAVALEREVSKDEWEPVCVSPCDATVGQHDRLRIGGRGVVSTGLLGLPRNGAPVYITAEPASKGGKVTGIVLTSTGGAVALAGVGLLLAAFATDTAARSDPDGPAAENAEARKAFRTAGYVSVASGLVLGGVGLALLLGNSGTELQIDQGEPKLGLGKRWWLTPRGLTF